MEFQRRYGNVLLLNKRFLIILDDRIMIPMPCVLSHVYKKERKRITKKAIAGTLYVLLFIFVSVSVAQVVDYYFVVIIFFYYY